MRHELGYFAPDPHIPHRKRLPSFLASLLIGTVLGLAGFFLLMVAMSLAVQTHTEPGRDAAAKTDLANYSLALDAFATHIGRYPTDAEGLAALASPPGEPDEEKAPYIQQLKPDPWGHPYIYHLGGPKGGNGYRISSLGADGQPGTPDDIDAGSDDPPPG